MELPKRKQNRLKGYDYSRPGCYFITICTRDKKHILWKREPTDKSAVGAATGRPYDGKDRESIQRRGNKTSRM